MKRAAAFSVLCLTCLLLILLLSACGGGDSAAGIYRGQYTKTDGVEHRHAVFSLELRDDGTGIHSRNGLEIEVVWTRDGRDFSMTETYQGMELHYTGTLTDGTLDIFNGEPADPWTCEYVYEKE